MYKERKETTYIEIGEITVITTSSYIYIYIYIGSLSQSKNNVESSNSVKYTMNI